MSTQGCINQAEMVKYQRENAEEPRTGPGTMDHGGVNHIDNANRNRRIILNIIRENAPATRRQLASMSGLSLSTTKRVVESLQAESLIKEAKLTSDDTAHPKRGRRAHAIRLNPDFAYSVGVVIRPGIMELCAVDLEGAVAYEKSHPVNDISREEYVREVARNVQDVIARMNGEKKRRLLGVGAGVAGVVSARDGIVHYCPNIPGWENTPLAEILADELDCDVLVDDSVRCRALAEKRYGTGRSLPDFLYLYFGRGVGAGMLIDNRIFRGANGLAGEFGHITVDGDGPLCRCGNNGCLEAIVSEEAILRSTREMIESNVYCSMRSALERGEELSLEMIQNEGRRGDKLAGMIINDVGEAIGTGIADLVNVLDPGVVVCGGEVIAQFGESVVGLVERTVKLRAIHSIAQRTRVLTSSVSQSAAARGAATLMIERFMANEVLSL